MDDRRILEHYPLPIARGYRRYRNAAEVRERHDAAYYLFEIYLKYVASVAVAHYLWGEARDHRVNAALKGLARPSLGEWVRFLRESLRFLGGQTDASPTTEALLTLLEGKTSQWERVVGLFNGLCAFRTGEASNREKVSLGMFLEELVSYRNRVLGHGAPLHRGHYERFGELFGQAFPEILEQAPILTAMRLVTFDTLQVEAGSRIECGVVEYMSDQPVRREEPLVIPYGTTAPEKHILYLLSEGGEFLPVDPLLIAHEEDVYILNEAEGSPEYLSYSTGKPYRPPRLGDGQRNLFQRSFRYRVDHQRLSRIGDDLARPVEAAPGAPSEEGERRLGDYRILREIGRGAMGAVFEAIQESLGRRVALKTLPGNFALEPKRVERFRREARATARIHHPSIVPVYEVDEAEGTHYYAMEFIDGSSLDDLLAQTREAAEEKTTKDSSTGDPEYIANAATQVALVAEGLEEAHRLGLIHRDVKPSNILVDSSGRYVLVDFGLVREEEAKTLTLSGEMVGTLRYMSPEQVSRRRVDARSDVYGLGVVLYEILTLKPPFEGDSEHEIQTATLFKDPTPPRKFNPRIHRDLETIVLHALEKDPDRRYPTAADLAADLRRLLRCEPIRAKPQSVLAKIARRAKRNKAAVAALATITVLVLCVGLLLVMAELERRRTALERYGPRVERAVVRLQGAPLSRKVGTGELGWMAPEAMFGADDFERVWAQDEGASGPAHIGVGGDRDPVAEAVEELARIAESVSGKPDAYYYRVRGLLLLERTEDAWTEVNDAVQRHPDFVPLRILRSFALEIRGDQAGAGRERELGLGYATSTWEKAWIAANDAFADRRWLDAERAYKRLIDEAVEPGKPFVGAAIEAHLGRGMALLELEEFADALIEFGIVADQCRDAVDPFLLRAKTHYLMGEKEKAEQILHRLWADTESSARRDEIALGVTTLYHAQADWNRGLEWSRKIHEPSIKARNCADFFLHRGETRKSMEALKETIALNPKDHLALWKLSMCCHRSKNYDEAERYCRQGLDAKPEFHPLIFQLGRTLRAQGRVEEALVEFERCVKAMRGLKPPSAWPTWPFNQMGDALRAHGELGDAIEAYGLAVRMCLGFKERARDTYRRLWATVRQGEGTVPFPSSLDRLVHDLERAREKAVEPRPSILATLALARVYDPKNRDTGTAIKLARQAIQEADHRGERDLVAYRVLAETYAFDRKWREAILTLERVLRLPGAPVVLAELADEYRGRLLPDLCSYATIDAVLEALQRVTLIGEGETWRYFKGTKKPPADWFQVPCDDRSWETGKTGIGYGDGDNRTVLSDMLGQYTTVYLRHGFSLENPASIRKLVLSVWVDDGLVAYLNGTEIGRIRAGSPGEEMPHNGLASASIADAVQVSFTVAPRLLRQENVLAIQGLNRGKTSSDFTLIPVLKGGRTCDLEEVQKLLDRYRPLSGNQEGKTLLAYLEGRACQLAGRHEEAAAKYREIVSLERHEPLPVLRLTEALAGSGARPEHVEAAFLSVPETVKSRWQWIAVAPKYTRRTLKEILAGVPVDAVDDTDLRWVLEELVHGRPIRINCGGKEYRGRDGSSWNKDRFYRNGNDSRARDPDEDIEGTDDDPLYMTNRWFPTSPDEFGYRIPLPYGLYRVTCHFAEVYYKTHGKRVFGLLLEGKVVLGTVQPKIITAERFVFDEVRVEDGILDITFTHERDNPNVSAIEVERLP